MTQALIELGPNRNLIAHKSVFDTLLEGVCGHLIAMEFPGLATVTPNYGAEFLEAFKAQIGDIVEKWLTDEPDIGPLSVSYAWDDLFFVLSITQPINIFERNEAINRLTQSLSQRPAVTWKLDDGGEQSVFFNEQTPYVGMIHDRRIRTVEWIADDLINALHNAKKEAYARNKWSHKHLVPGLIDPFEDLTERQLTDIDLRKDRQQHRTRNGFLQSLCDDHLHVDFWPVENPLTSELAGFSMVPTRFLLQTRYTSDPAFTEDDMIDLDGAEAANQAADLGLTYEFDVAVLRTTLRHINDTLTTPLGKQMRLFVPMHTDSLMVDDHFEEIRNLFEEYRACAGQLTLILDTSRGPGRFIELKGLQTTMAQWRESFGIRFGMDRLVSGSPDTYLRTYDGTPYWEALDLDIARIGGIPEKHQAQASRYTDAIRSNVLECSDAGIQVLAPAGVTPEMARAVSQGAEILLERDYSDIREPQRINMMCERVAAEQERLDHNGNLINITHLFGRSPKRK